MIDRIAQMDSPDDFEKLCKHLLSAEWEDFQAIDDSGGDRGNDGYSESREIMVQMYCPEKPEKANAVSYKAKIKKDLQKAKKLVDSGEYKIKKWIFITPRKMSEEVQTCIKLEASALGFSGISWGSPKLAELLAKHNHLRRMFPDLIAQDFEKQIEGLQSTITDRLDNINEVRREYQTQLEKKYQQRIDQAKETLEHEKFEAAKKELEAILKEIELEVETIDAHLRFRAYNNLGVCELNLGNQAKAAELFEKAYEAEPQLPKAISALAMSKLFKGVPEEGLSIINNLLEKYPDDDQAISIRANIYYAQGNYTELIPFLRSKGKIALVHWFEGFERMSQKDYVGAKDSFEAVLRIEPKNIRARLMIAQNIMVEMKSITQHNPFLPDRVPPEIKKKFTRAIDCLLEAISHFKETGQKVDLEMAYTNLSGCYVAIGQYEEAVKAASEAISVDPKSAVAFLNKGIAQLRLGKYTDAIQNFKIYKDLGGGEIEVDRHIAFCSMRMGDLTTAQPIIEALLERGPSLDLGIAELAIDLYSRKLDNENLNPLLERLEKDFPSNPQALRIRAHFRQRRGLEGAEALIRRALANSVTPLERMLAEIDLADLHYEQKNYEPAGEIYKKYVNLKEGNQATYRFAECLVRSGQYGALLTWIDTLDPKVREHYVIRQVEGHANLYLENLEKASQIFKDLFEKNPEVIQYLVLYGLCRFRLGREVDTKNAYDAIKNRVHETKDLLILSAEYEQIGEWDTALELTFRALENDPNNSKAHLAFILTFVKREQIMSGESEEKYVKAFQKTIGEFSKRFPDEKAFQSIPIKENDISGILKLADQMAEMTTTAANLYRDSKAPLAGIPKLTGKDPFDVWAGFINLQDVGIRMSFGAPDELAIEWTTVVNAFDASIVVDIYPLLLLGHFDRLDLLSKLFKKIYVHQSVVDNLTETIARHKIGVQKGAAVFGKVGEQYRMSEIPPELVKREVDLLEKIKRFLTTDKNIEVCGLSRENPKDVKNIINALHESTRDSVLLAQELNVPIYCDDRILRLILHRDYRIASFSSQTLFDVARKDGVLSLDERFDLQTGLIELNYSYLSINAGFIYTQLKKTGFQIKDVEGAISILAGKETDIQSLSVVLADLFSLMMSDESADMVLKLSAFTHIIRVTMRNHDINKVEEGIFINLQKRIVPEKHGELKEMIRQVFFEATKDET